MKARPATFTLAINRREAEIIRDALYAYQRIKVKAIDSFEAYSEHQSDITTAALLEIDFQNLVKEATR